MAGLAKLHAEPLLTGQERPCEGLTMRTTVLTCVFVEVQSYEISQLQGGASNGVLAMLLDVWHDVDDIIHGAILCADRVLKRCEGDGTAVERQALERRTLLLLVTTPFLLVLLGGEVSPILLAALLAHGTTAAGTTAAAVTPRGGLRPAICLCS